MKTLWLLLPALACAAPARAAQQNDSVTVIHAGAVLDPRTGSVTRNITLILRDGRIAQIGPGIAAPAGAHVVNAPNLTLLPGLIDTHVHLTLAGRPRDNARVTLEAGFTTVADLGSANGVGARIKKLIDADSIPGPRMIAAGSWIGGKGGVCEFGGATIRGATEARARAEADVAAGAQILKLCVTDWLDPVVQFPDSVELTADEIAAVADVAARAHIPVAAHAIGAAGVTAALRAGVRYFAHTPLVDAAGARAIAQANACVSSTMTTLLLGQSSAPLRKSFDELRRAGVRITAGTDAGVLAHGNNAEELVTLVSLGLTPLDAIRAATTVAAACLGLQGAGTLDVDAPADLIGVTGNPSGDVTTLRTPALVIKGGRIVRQQATADTFAIYKLQWPVGHETYRTVSAGDVDTLLTQWNFRYIGGNVALKTALVQKRDGTPIHFDAKGRNSTITPIDMSVDVGDSEVQLRNFTRTSAVARPNAFFTMPHYPPVSVEQALFRYWLDRGRPASVSLLPVGAASFELRGRDTLNVGSAKVVLDRYSVSGVVWGRQSMWTRGRDIIAVANGDAEEDRFEAVRAGYQQHLQHFVNGAVADGLADLAVIARSIKPIESGRYAVTGARLIDGTGGPAIDDAVIVVDSGRIIAIGPRASVTLPRGIRTVDARGKSIMPGLWDMHVHYEQVEWPVASLAAGVTTARDAGNELELVRGLRDAIRSGRALGPRLLVAGVIDSGDQPLGIHVAETPEKAIEVVRMYHGAGFEQIKIYGSLKPELVKVVADEAHRLGMTVTGHVPAGMNAIEFVTAGADQINHMGFMTAVLRPRAQAGQPRQPVDLTSPDAQKALAFFREHGTVLDPSLARGEVGSHPRDTAFVQWEPGMRGAPVELVTILNAMGSPTNGIAGLQRSLTVVNGLREQGIPIMLGTDLVLPGHSMHRELELAVQGGFTPMQAIQAATIVPARAMKLDRESGTLERGKRADFVILDANPLENISNIRRVHAVITAGRMYDPAPLWRAAGFKP